MATLDEVIDFQLKQLGAAAFAKDAAGMKRRTYFIERLLDLKRRTLGLT